MGSELTQVHLDTLADGSAPDLWEHEWRKLLANVQDPNTDPEARRQIRLTVTVEPSEDRETADISIDCDLKLAAVRGVRSRIFMGQRGKEYVAVEYDPRQADLFQEPDPDIKPIDREEAGT